MHNPLKSEEEAFRWLMIIVAAAALVGLVVVVTRPLVGAIVLAAEVALGVFLIGRGSRGRDSVAVETAVSSDGRHRILVIANQTVAGRALLDEIRSRAKPETEILVVTPALNQSALKHWASDVDEAIATAGKRLAESLAALAAAGFEARGEVGDPEPNVAIEDALRAFAASEIVISTLPPGRSNWLERGVVERAREDLDIPVAHVVVDIEAERPA